MPYLPCFVELNNSLMSTTPNVKNVKSVSAGGESVTIDTNAAKWDDRNENKKDLTKVRNRQVRVTFGAIRGAFPS